MSYHLQRVSLFFELIISIAQFFQSLIYFWLRIIFLCSHFNFRCLEPFFSIQVFRAIFFFNLGVQSHFFQFRYSEPHFSIQAFTAIVQAFRVAVLGIQNHLFQFRHLESQFQMCRAILFRYSKLHIQAFKAIFSIQAFKVMVLGIQSHSHSLGVQSHSFRCLEPSYLSIQSVGFRLLEPFFQFRCSKSWCQAFRATFIVQVFRVVVLGVQSYLFQFLVFKLTFFNLGVQSLDFRAFRANILRHSESTAWSCSLHLSFQSLSSFQFPQWHLFISISFLASFFFKNHLGQTPFFEIVIFSFLVS